MTQLLPQLLDVQVAADPAALRALAGAVGSVAACSYAADHWGLYLWRAAPQADDGIHWIGSWELVANLAVDGRTMVAHVVISQPWDGTRCAVYAEEGWSTIGADGGHVYLARQVQLT